MGKKISNGMPLSTALSIALEGLPNDLDDASLRDALREWARKWGEKRALSLEDDDIDEEISAALAARRKDKHRG